MELSSGAVRKRKFTGISGSTLKLIAIVSMFIDHIGAAVLENGLLDSTLAPAGAALRSQLISLDRILRAIGRPAFPIFCFLLVEGFLHTRDAKKYALRLFLFALISEIPFDLAIHGKPVAWNMQNVYFTLLIGLLVMMASARFSQNTSGNPAPRELRIGKYRLDNVWIQSLIFALGLAAGYLLRTDYGFKGVLLIEILYFFRYDRRNQCVAGAIAMSWELPAPLAFLPVYAYNGKRGLSLKYFFYLFYPVHLLILAGIARYCAGL